MNFILGGKMGDLIHTLYVVKNTPGKHDLFISDKGEGFIYDLPKTVEQLSFLRSQPYVNSLSVWNGEHGVDLTSWRSKAYSTSWTNLMAREYGVPVNSDPWICTPTNLFWRSKIVVHCSTVGFRRGNWPRLVNPVFLGTEEEWQNFKVGTFYQAKSLADYFTVIGSCRHFIGNQSAPLAIAHALGVRRTAILNPTDKNAYLGEESIYSNFDYVL